MQQTSAKLHDVTSERQKAFEHTRHRIDELRQIIQRLISVYEQHNQRHRGSAKKPVCFEHYPQIVTSDPRLDPRKSDAHLDWNCGALITSGAPTPQSQPVAAAEGQSPEGTE